MKKQLLTLFLSVIAIASIASCSSYAKVRAAKPAANNFGQSKQLVVVQSTGRRTYREEIFAQMKKQTISSGWWQFKDAQEKGIEIKLMGDKAEVTPALPQNGVVYIKVDFFEANAEKDVEETTRTNRKTKKKYTTRKQVYRGNAIFAVTSVDSKGKAILSEKEFKGKSKIYIGEGDEKETAKNAALADAVKNFLASITPTFVTMSIMVDDKSDDMDPVIKSINNGDLTTAENLLKKLPQTRADVIYNTAVVYDAMGKYEEALTLYDKSMSLGGKSFYKKSRSACASRLQAQKALEN